MAMLEPESGKIDGNYRRQYGSGNILSRRGDEGFHWLALSSATNVVKLGRIDHRYSTPCRATGNREKRWPHALLGLDGQHQRGQLFLTRLSLRRRRIRRYRTRCRLASPGTGLLMPRAFPGDESGNGSGNPAKRKLARRSPAIIHRRHASPVDLPAEALASATFPEPRPRRLYSKCLRPVGRSTSRCAWTDFVAQQLPGQLDYRDTEAMPWRRQTVWPNVHFVPIWWISVWEERKTTSIQTAADPSDGPRIKTLGENHADNTNSSRQRNDRPIRSGLDINQRHCREVTGASWSVRVFPRIRRRGVQQMDIPTDPKAFGVQRRPFIFRRYGLMFNTKILVRWRRRDENCAGDADAPKETPDHSISKRQFFVGKLRRHAFDFQTFRR